jgi:nitrite reductase/ring-hydroxylating ferredoxin subunit
VRAEFEGKPILVVKREDRVYAIDGTCAHMGGPLAEGKLEGDTIQCPWHGSRFDIKDGNLVNGPSIYSQACMETRIANGMVEVRKSVACAPAQVKAIPAQLSAELRVI